MTVTIDPPTSYRHWSQRPSRIALPAPWPSPEMIQTPDGRWWRELLNDDPYWANLGYAPRGTTRWRRFWRHWHHGRLMRYPALSVLAFCARDAVSYPKADAPDQGSVRAVSDGA